MKAKEIQALESYFKTENEHWNGYAFEILCEVLKQGNFENPEIPLQLFSAAVDIFTEQYETPLKAVQNFNKEIDKKKLNPTQKLFVYLWVLKYFKNSEFDHTDTSEIEELLKGQISRLKVEVENLPESNKPLVRNMRGTLKEFVQKELEQMPETFKDLEPLQKFNVLCKLMPYVFPKVESISSKDGEPFSFD